MSEPGGGPIDLGIPLGRGVEILHWEEDGLLALNKPEGVRSHPNREGRPDPKSLICAPYDLKQECYLLEGGKPLHLCHRLDSPTSGAILLAGDREVADVLRKAFASGDVDKGYYGVARGSGPRKGVIWEDFLERELHHTKLRVKRSIRQRMEGRRAHGISARTKVECRRKLEVCGETISLLLLQPLTGRTHQLRVQCAERKLPLLGDRTYGDFRFNREFANETGVRQLLLHAAWIRCSLQLRGRRVEIEVKAPFPEYFKGFC